MYRSPSADVRPISTRDRGYIHMTVSSLGNAGRHKQSPGKHGSKAYTLDLSILGMLLDVKLSRPAEAGLGQRTAVWSNLCLSWSVKTRPIFRRSALFWHGVMHPKAMFAAHYADSAMLQSVRLLPSPHLAFASPCER